MFFREMLTILILGALPCAAKADLFMLAQPQPANALWINPGFYSYHFQREKDLNNRNFGLGAEYDFSSVSAITVGIYDNSDRQTTHYAGYYWRPLLVGPARLGVVLGGMDGYPNMRNGGWFAAAIPTLTLASDRFGINVFYVPSYQNRLYGALSFQLNIRVF